VTTAIETGNDVLFKMRSMDLKIWVWCPHCMAGHTISPNEAILEEQTSVSETELSPVELSETELSDTELSPAEPLPYEESTEERDVH
jgi:hypothetical protein